MGDARFWSVCFFPSRRRKITLKHSLSSSTRAECKNCENTGLPGNSVRSDRFRLKIENPVNFQGIHLKFCTQRPENILLDMFRFFNPIPILKISKISNKLRQQFENAFVLSFFENQSVLCLKTVCLPAFLVNSYF